MVSDKEAEYLRELLYSRSVHYEIIETGDGNFFFITDDLNIPHGSGSKYDSITLAAQGRFGYHCFIEVRELSRKKENPKTFAFVICPFLVNNNHSFSRTLGDFIAKADYGKKEILVYIIGRMAFSAAKDKGHSAAEIFSNPREFVPNDFTAVMTDIEIVATTYQEVVGLTSLSPEYRSSLCPYCRLE